MRNADSPSIDEEREPSDSDRHLAAARPLRRPLHRGRLGQLAADVKEGEDKVMLVVQLGRQHDLHLLVEVRGRVVVKDRSRGARGEYRPARFTVDALGEERGRDYSHISHIVHFIEDVFLYTQQ